MNLNRFDARIGLLFSFVLYLCVAQGQHPNIQFDPVYSGFTNPAEITHAGDGSGRLFVAELGGKIKIIDNGTTLATAFLNITSIVVSGGESGLLGLEFDPQYTVNGFFYVHYIDMNGDSQISRYTRSAGNVNVANANSELKILNIFQPAPNHNGGCIRFGPDGYLYIGMGDGGGGNDPQNRAQNPAMMLGKMLRIDVAGASMATPYSIPPTNPHVGDVGVLDEIWARGLRNPWRFSFDQLTGDLWIGDVGQDAKEEVNYASGNSLGGENYGWRCYEGTSARLLGGCGPMANYTFPVFEYDHVGEEGRSVTGGVVYRGSAFPCLQGVYFCAEIYQNLIWTVLPDDMGGWTNQEHSGLGISQIISFGTDEQGELYAVSNGGTIYQVQGEPVVLTDDPIVTGTYMSYGSLTADGSILSNANVVFDAANVVLEPSFEVAFNAAFEVISTCQQ